MEVDMSQMLARVAEEMLIAAKTAPKARGRDNIVMGIETAEGINRIADELKAMVKEGAPPYFARDADSIQKCGVMVLLGTRIAPIDLHPCGMCGFKDCAEKRKHPEHPCSFNTGDLGIAIGSAVSIAMDRRVDNRIMYTVGQAAMRLGLPSTDARFVMGIPLSASAKNVFFDRHA